MWEEQELSVRAEELYQRFCSTKQESLRLRCALDGFFLAGIPEDQRREYGRCLKRRIRPAVTQLIRQGDRRRLEQLERQGWFGERELDEFIRTAIEQDQPAMLICLLQLKKKNYGFKGRRLEL